MCFKKINWKLRIINGDLQFIVNISVFHIKYYHVNEIIERIQRKKLKTKIVHFIGKISFFNLLTPTNAWITKLLFLLELLKLKTENVVRRRHTTAKRFHLIKSYLKSSKHV